MKIKNISMMQALASGTSLSSTGKRDKVRLSVPGDEPSDKRMEVIGVVIVCVVVQRGRSREE